MNGKISVSILSNIKTLVLAFCLLLKISRFVSFRVGETSDPKALNIGEGFMIYLLEVNGFRLRSHDSGTF